MGAILVVGNTTVFIYPTFKTLLEKQICLDGYPAYITSVGWSGYDDDKISRVGFMALSKEHSHRFSKIF